MTQPQLDSSRRATLLAIGAGPEQVPAIRAAQGLGFCVVATDRNPAAVGLTIADQAHSVDIADEAAVVALARSIDDLIGVVPAPVGSLLTTVGAVNDGLGFAGITRSAAWSCVDKRRFHLVSKAAGANRPMQAVLADAVHLTTVAERVGYPVVVKPAYGSGSKGVEVVLDHAAVDAAQERLAALGATTVLVEQMVAGQEFGIDGYVQDGVFTLLLARRKHLTPLPWRQEMGYDAPAPITMELQQAVTAEVQRVVEATGIDACLLNADVVVATDARPYVIEVAGRPGALSISDYLVPVSTGINFIELGIALALGQRVSPTHMAHNAVCLRYLPAPAGIVRARPEIPADDPMILHASCRLTPGMELREIRDARDALARGVVITRGATVADAARHAEAVAAQIVSSTQITSSEREAVS